jgi:hypothetical protein
MLRGAPELERTVVFLLTSIAETLLRCRYFPISIYKRIRILLQFLINSSF